MTDRKVTAGKTVSNMGSGAALAFVVVAWVAGPLGLPTPTGIEAALTAIFSGAIQHWLNK